MLGGHSPALRQGCLRSILACKAPRRISPVEATTTCRIIVVDEGAATHFARRIKVWNGLTCGIEHLELGIHKVATEATVRTHTHSEHVVRAGGEPTGLSAWLRDTYDLSDRESEIALLIAQGRSKTYIAEHLFLSENTVRTHAKNAYAKLDVHSKQELMDLMEQAAND